MGLGAANDICTGVEPDDTVSDDELNNTAAMSSRDDSGTSLTGENTGLVRPEATASASDTETEDVTRCAAFGFA